MSTDDASIVRELLVVADVTPAVVVLEGIPCEGLWLLSGCLLALHVVVEEFDDLLVSLAVEVPQAMAVRHRRAVTDHALVKGRGCAGVGRVVLVRHGAHGLREWSLIVQGVRVSVFGCLLVRTG